MPFGIIFDICICHTSCPDWGVPWFCFVSPVNLRASTSMTQQQLSFKSWKTYLPSLIL